MGRQGVESLMGGGGGGPLFPPPPKSAPGFIHPSLFNSKKRKYAHPGLKKKSSIFSLFFGNEISTRRLLVLFTFKNTPILMFFKVFIAFCSNVTTGAYALNRYFENSY